jgi:hypothetical protein
LLIACAVLRFPPVVWSGCKPQTIPDPYQVASQLIVLLITMMIAERPG